MRPEWWRLRRFGSVLSRDTLILLQSGCLNVMKRRIEADTNRNGRQTGQRVLYTAEPQTLGQTLERSNVCSRLANAVCIAVAGCNGVVTVQRIFREFGSQNEATAAILRS